MLHYVEHGEGTPLVALHGAGVDHREIEAAIEAIAPEAGYRRIYPDLPGMGSPADGLTSNQDVVRSANEQANEAIRAQIKDLDDRIAAEWNTATVENLGEKTAETERLADEFTKRIVDEAMRDE